MNKPNTSNLIFTQGILSKYPIVNTLVENVIAEWEKQPERDLEGGNDKRFFSLEFGGEKLFIVYDEAYSPETHMTDHSKPETYTVMFADEY